MDWMMTDIVDIGTLRCHANVHDGTNAALIKHENDNMEIVVSMMILSVIYHIVKLMILKRVTVAPQ